MPRPVVSPPVLPPRYEPWPETARALLGRGGASEVWRVRDTTLGLLVAIKVLRSEGARLAGRLEREAIVSASVVHPNVIALHDMGRTPDGKPYLAFALASEGSLLDHAGRPPRWPLLKDLTIGLLDALGALHARNILHLDVKLSNLLVHRIGPRERVLWLADLGVARARWSEDEDEGMVLGTVGYMAPERLTGQHMLWGPPTDLFSVGAVLYRLLTGELPYPAKDPVEALAARQRPPGQVPVREGMVVPAGLEDIVLAMLQPDRRSRYDLAADVARAIEALPSISSGPTLGGPGLAQPPRLALLAEQGEDSLVNWPPADQTQPRRQARLKRQRSLGITWNKPDPLRPPRRRPRPYIPRRVPQAPHLVVHREIPVVGRERELDHLWRAARAVLRHRLPVMVTLLGKRGTGRTRIVDELTRTMERAGIATGVRLDFAGRSGPDHGLDGALRRLLPPLAERRSYRNDIARTLSRLRELPPAACRQDAAALADVIAPTDEGALPDRAVARSFVVEHLAAHAWRGLTWLWLDDVHLAGDSDAAWALVEMLFAQKAPTLILCGALDSQKHLRALRPLRRIEARHPRRCRRISLGPLSDADAHRLVRAYLPMEPALAKELVACAHGHPQYLHDLIAHQVRLGALVPGSADELSGNPIWHRTPDAPPLPRSRTEFARQRLTAALDGEQDLLYALLVVRLAGTGAPERVVSRVAGGDLDRLVAKGLVRVEGGGLHVVSEHLKQAIDGLPRDEHLDHTAHENLAAAWLEEHDDPLAEARSGLHLALAGRHADALPRLRTALQRLSGSLRPLPLSRVALRTMTLAREAGEPGRDAWVDAALLRAEALWALGLAEDALALDQELEAEDLSPVQAVAAACLHAAHLGGSGDVDAGLARLEQAHIHLPGVPTDSLALLLLTRAGLHHQEGEDIDAGADLAEVMALDPPTPLRTRALLLRARTLVGRDDTGARRAADEALSLARRSGRLDHEVGAWQILARIAAIEGKETDTADALEAAIVRLRRVGERAASGQLLAILGPLRRDVGDLRAAETAWVEALALEATGREPFARAARLGLAVNAALDADERRIRKLATGAGRVQSPAEERAWRLLDLLVRQLQGKPLAAPPSDLWGTALADGTDAQVLVELLVEALAVQHPDVAMAAQHALDARLSADPRARERIARIRGRIAG